MAYDQNNIFAKILRGEIPCDKVYEDSYVLAFRDISPRAPVHILVIPKGSYISTQDFYERATEAEIAGFMRAIPHIAAEAGVAESGYRTITNHGRDARQEVPHMHLHILGRTDLKAMLPLTEN